MVEAHNAAADITARRVVVGCHQWTHTCVGTQDAGGGKAWRKLFAFAHQHFHLFWCHLHIVYGVDRHTVAGGTNHTHGVAWHKDVGVGWLTATVYHHVVHTVSVHEQCSLSWEHTYSGSCHLGNLLTPNTSRIYYDITISLLSLLCVVVIQFHTHHSVAILDERHHFVVVEHICSVQTCVKHVCHGQAEWVNRAVGHAHRADKVSVDCWLQADGFLWVDCLGTNACLVAGCYECSLVSKIVLWQCDEQTIGLIHAVTSDFAKRHIFLDTLLCRLTIGNSITSTTVQQTMIAASSTIREVESLYKQCRQTTHSTIAGSTSTCNTSSDNDYVVMFHSAFIHLKIV